MAEGFALAEIMTVDLRSLNLTSALAIGIQPISGVNILDSNGNRVLDSAGRCQMAIDEHGMGARVSAILNAFYYRAIAASIYELTRQLDNVGEFGKTLITLSSEFGRSPQPSGSGSDHGNESVGVQMWSKMFPEAPQIAGYLRVNSATGYTGTWEGAPMPAGFGRPGLLTTSSIAASILTAMDVPSPFAEPSVLARAADGLFRFTIGADNV
jgi:hypothetical protein